MASRWIRGSKLSNKRIGQLIDYFAIEVPAIKAAGILGINRHSAERIYNVIREMLASECEKESPPADVEMPQEADVNEFQESGEIDVDGTTVPVYGIIMRNGKAYTRPLGAVQIETARRMVKSRRSPGSDAVDVSIGPFDALAIGGTKHLLIRRKGDTPHAGETRRPSSADNFWSFVKTKLGRYYGVRGARLFLYLKEMEFRYNHRNEDLRKVIRDILKNNHL